MAEEVVVGELTARNVCEPFIFKEVTWKISNASSLPRSSADEVKSPEFSFANGTWTLCIYAMDIDFVPHTIHFRLFRLQPRDVEQEVYFKFFLKSSDGQKIEDFICCNKFNMFSHGYVTDCAMERSQFDEKLREFASDDTLVVVCQMQTKETAAEDTSEEMDGARPITSELSERSEFESFIFNEITWKIPDISSFPTSNGSVVRSPEFSFANGTWVLRLDEEDIEVWEGWGTDPFLRIGLRRLQSLAEADQEVHLKFLLTTSDGQNLDSFICYHKFTSSDGENGSSVMRCEVEEKMEDVAPDDTLVVVCRMHTDETAVESTSPEEASRPTASADE